jgi:hypothetical protein
MPFLLPSVHHLVHFSAAFAGAFSLDPFFCSSVFLLLPRYSVCGLFPWSLGQVCSPGPVRCFWLELMGTTEDERGRRNRPEAVQGLELLTM